MDLRSRKSDVKTDRRRKRDPRICAKKRGNKDSCLRINESHQTHDHKESYADIQRARDVEMQQQRSHETEPNRATNLDRERSEPKTISEEKIKRGYLVRPREKICPSYLRTGLCDLVSSCLFNHPTCKFFRRGLCKDGSACKFIHAKNNEAPRLPNTMLQALSLDVKILAGSYKAKEQRRI